MLKRFFFLPPLSLIISGVKVTSFGKWVFNIDQSIETTFITFLLNLIHLHNINVFYVDAAQVSMCEH